MTEWNTKELIGSPRQSARSIDPVFATSIDTMELAVDIDVRQFNDTIITVFNQDITNKLEYEVRVTNEYESGEHILLWSNILDGSDYDECILCRHARVLVYVKSASAGFPCIVKIDIISGR